MLEKLKRVIKRSGIKINTDELDNAVDRLNNKFMKAISDSQKKLTRKIENLTADKKYSEALEVAKELEKVEQVLRRHLEYLAEEDDEDFYDRLIWKVDEDDECENCNCEDDEYFDDDELGIGTIYVDEIERDGNTIYVDQEGKEIEFITAEELDRMLTEDRINRNKKRK